MHHHPKFQNLVDFELAFKFLRIYAEPAKMNATLHLDARLGSFGTMHTAVRTSLFRGDVHTAKCSFGSTLSADKPSSEA